LNSGDAIQFEILIEPVPAGGDDALQLIGLGEAAAGKTGSEQTELRSAIRLFRRPPFRQRRSAATALARNLAPEALVAQSPAAMGGRAQRRDRKNGVMCGRLLACKDFFAAMDRRLAVMCPACWCGTYDRWP
jgi:hypothetical protein